MLEQRQATIKRLYAWQLRTGSGRSEGLPGVFHLRGAPFGKDSRATCTIPRRPSR